MTNKELTEYIETEIPDMFGEIDELASIRYEKFLTRMKYLIEKHAGVLPKYNKGKHINDFWTCGNCGYRITEAGFKYCPNCGYFLTTKFPNYK